MTRANSITDGNLQAEAQSSIPATKACAMFKFVNPFPRIEKTKLYFFFRNISNKKCLNVKRVALLQRQTITFVFV